MKEDSNECFWGAYSMIRRLVLVLSLALLFTLAACESEKTERIEAVESGGNSVVVEESPQAVGDGKDVYPLIEDCIPPILIDSAYFDIDDDGVCENCTMTCGPTSGVFTVVFTVTVDNTIKYKNTFHLAYGELSFAEKDGIPYFVRDNEYHRLFLENGRIVIEGLDPQYESYWGDSDWNYDLKTP